MALRLSCPSLSSALTTIHLPPSSNQGATGAGQGAEAKGCVMHLNANQARRPVSPESPLSSADVTQVPQPVQHSSAFIFISAGAVSCHSLSKDTTQTPSFVCTTETHRMQKIPLTIYHLYRLGIATLLHTHN